MSRDSAPAEKALHQWMQEVTSILCYQPEIPLAHKTDLANALAEYEKANGLLNVKETK